MMRYRSIGAALVACALPLSATAESMEDMMSAANQQLASMGTDFRIAYAEYITSAESGQVGRILFASDHGNKQLSSDWVPGDDRRIWNTAYPGLVGTNDLSIAVDGVDVTQNLHPNNTLATGADLQAYHNVNATWNSVACSDIQLVDLGNAPFDIGYVQFAYGFGGIPGVVADLSHAGMLPRDFFDLVAPNGGNFILGVTFTLVWVDENGRTDVDNNGKSDVAIREIYYNENFPWQDNPNDVTFDGTIDLESVALHEMGHGLSQAHFGNVGFVDRNRNGAVDPGEISSSPEASMNASHTVAHRTVEGTDLGGHCSNWANWPVN